MSVGVNRENALSDALGAILLVAVVGMAVAVISAVILSEPVPEKIPALNADITTIGRTILITHNGGDSLEKADMAIIIDGNETKNSFQRIDGTPWSAWAVGDSLYYNVPPGQPMPQGMTIFFVGGSSARIITSMGVPQTVSAGGLYPTGTGTATPTPAPVADFNGTPTSGTVPLTVTFTDLSTRTPTSWNWTFGDIGAGNTSTSQNPSHMYTTAGTYTVTLVASNAGGSDTKTQTGFTVTPPLSGFTVEAWVKWNIDPNPGNDTTRKWATIVVDGTADGNRRYQLQHNLDNSKFEFALSTTNTSGAFVQSNIKPGVGTWYYVTGVYNQTPGTMAIFVNGVQNSSKVVDSSGLRPSPNLYQRGGPAGISYNNNDGRGLVINRIFNGEIWGLNTYERALSPAEIAANFAKGGPTPNASPVASFTGSPTTGPPNLIVSFTDSSTGTPTSWNWSFGDGSLVNATVQNPVHTYSSAGTYTVSLNATNAGGSNTKTQTGYITVTSPPSGFTVEAWVKWNILPNWGGNVSRQWATIVIDGNSDSNRRYQLQHSSTNSYFEFAREKNSGDMTYIESTTSPSTGVWYYVVGVYDQTPGTMSIFVNGVQEHGLNTGSADTTGLRPSPNIYQIGGPSGITFNGANNQRIFDGDIKGLNTYERALTQAEITANFAKGVPTPIVPPVANFTCTPTSGPVPLTVSFVDNSTNIPTSWLWNFGDGSSSSTQNPSHTYNAPGTYTVSLNATNAGGSNTKTQTGYITVNVPVPVADFTGVPTSGTAQLTVIFTDSSTNTPTSWNWSFGDGALVNATVQNPVHTYSSAGTYTVSLNATNAGGSNTNTKTGYITATQPGFTVKAWVKWINKPIIPNPVPTNLTNQTYATIVLGGSSNTNRQYHLQHDQYDTKFELDITTVTAAAAGGQGVHVWSTTTPVNGMWYLVTGVYDQTAGKIAIYVNGNQEGSWGSADSSGLRAYSGDQQIGGPNGICYAGFIPCTSKTRILNGSISGVQTYDYAMSQTEIKAHYDAGDHPA